jgi:uncharacterized protein involved in outer membrane biogenesis
VRRLIRLILIGTCVALVLLALIAELWLDSLIAEPGRLLLEHSLSVATGVETKIEGDFDLDFVPKLRVEATQLTFTPGKELDPLLTIEYAKLKFDPWIWVTRREVIIERLQLSGARLNLQSTGDSSGIDASLLFAPADDGANVEVGFQIERFELEDFRIEYRDPADIATRVMVVDELLLTTDTPKVAVSLFVTGSVEESPFSIQGEIGAAKKRADSTTPHPFFLRARLPYANAEFEVVGHLAEPTRLRGFNADVSIVASEIAAVLPASIGTLPPLGPLRVTAHLQDKDGVITLENLKAEISGDSRVSLSANGSIPDPRVLLGAELDLRLEADGLALIQPFVDFPLPVLDSIDIEIQISDSNGSLGVQGQLRASSGESELHGFEEAPLIFEPPARELPGVAVVNQPERFTIDLSGGINDLREIDEITFDAAIETTSLETVGALLGLAWPAVGPVSFTGRLTGSGEELEALGNWRFAESEFLGNATASFAAGTRPSLYARVDSSHVRLRDIEIAPKEETSDPKPTDKVGWGSWWSGSDPLPFERLRAVDLDIELRANRMTGEEGLEFHDVSVALQLDDGLLVMRETATSIDGGSLQAELRVDARGPDPTLALRVDSDELGLGQSWKQLLESSKSAGIVDASIALESHGTSAPEIRANLNGSFNAVLRDGVVASKFGDMFVTNLMKLSLPALLSPGQLTGLGCIIIEFDIEAGVAGARTLVVESENVIVVGTGEINVGTDTVSVVLSPKARKPGLLNLSAEVDVTGSIAEPVFNVQQSSIPGHLTQGLFANLLAPVSAAFNSKGGGARQLCQEGLTPQEQSPE